MNFERTNLRLVVFHYLMKFEKEWILLCASLIAGVARVSAAAPAPSPDIRRDATVEAVQRVMPAVVNIRTETIIERHDPFEQLLQGFFGRSYRQPGPETTYSLGS